MITNTHVQQALQLYVPLIAPTGYTKDILIQDMRRFVQAADEARWLNFSLFAFHVPGEEKQTFLFNQEEIAQNAHRNRQ